MFWPCLERSDQRMRQCCECVWLIVDNLIFFSVVQLATSRPKNGVGRPRLLPLLLLSLEEVMRNFLALFHSLRPKNGPVLWVSVADCWFFSVLSVFCNRPYLSQKMALEGPACFHFFLFHWRRWCGNFWHCFNRFGRRMGLIVEFFIFGLCCLISHISAKKWS